MADELPLLDAGRREVAEAMAPGGEPPAVTFLAPLDPLVWDRELLRSLFDFDYVWEVVRAGAEAALGLLRPADPVRRPVRRAIEPRIDRRAGRLRIIDVWWEDGFDPLAAEGFVEAFADALVRIGAFVWRPDSSGRASSGSGRSAPRSAPTRPAGSAQRGTVTTVEGEPQLPALSTGGPGTRTCGRAPSARVIDVTVVAPELVHPRRPSAARP